MRTRGVQVNHFLDTLPRAGDQARVVQKVDNAIRRLNHYPADSVVYFVNNYPLDRDLSGG